MKNSHIEWTDHTFNPWIGCTKVSPGCANCYAAARDKRFTGGAHWGKGAPRRRTSATNWRQPLAWDKAATNHFQEVRMYDGTRYRGTMDEIAALNLPVDDMALAMPSRPRVFCASLADWLDDEVPIEWLADLIDLWRVCTNLDILALSKRLENWRPRLQAVRNYALTHDLFDLHSFVHQWLDRADLAPPANIWIGTSVEDQTRADERIPLLLEIPARVRFLSCEPLLGLVDLAQACGGAAVSARLDWAIVGGESGPGARLFYVEHARSLVAQCKAAGVACFVKQMGGRIRGDWREFVPIYKFMTDLSDGGVFNFIPAVVGERAGQPPDDDMDFQLFDAKGGDMEKWPEDLRVREFPKTEGGA